MAKKKFSRNVREFHGKFRHFYTFYYYQQKILRTKAHEAAVANDIMASNVCDGIADELANIVQHVKLLKEDFENLMETGLINKEA